MASHPVVEPSSPGWSRSRVIPRRRRPPTPRGRTSTPPSHGRPGCLRWRVDRWVSRGSSTSCKSSVGWWMYSSYSDFRRSTSHSTRRHTWSESRTPCPPRPGPVHGTYPYVCVYRRHPESDGDSRRAGTRTWPTYKWMGSTGRPSTWTSTVNRVSRKPTSRPMTSTSTLLYRGRSRHVRVTSDWGP